MATKIDRSAPPSPALRSGSLRSPPLRAGEGGAEQNTNNQQEKKSTKSISGLDLYATPFQRSSWQCQTLMSRFAGTACLSAGMGREGAVGEGPEAGLLGEPTWAGAINRDSGNRQTSNADGPPGH